MLYSVEYGVFYLGIKHHPTKTKRTGNQKIVVSRYVYATCLFEKIDQKSVDKLSTRQMRTVLKACKKVLTKETK